MINYFKIFDLPTSFEIDEIKLEAKYLQLQQQFHPDNANLADIEKSVTFNQAYKALSSKINRASHILQLNNINIEDDSQAPKVDVATLQQILELQEEIEHIKPDRIADLKSEIKENLNNLFEEIAQNLEQNNFEIASQNLIKAKYFDKSLSDLKLKKKQ